MNKRHNNLLRRATRSASLLPLALASAQALALDCNTASSELCTIEIAPGGGAGVELTAPGTQFTATVDGSGFEIRGTVHLGGREQAEAGPAAASAGAQVLYDAYLVVEYANPAQPEAGFRRLRGTAEMRREADADATPGFGTLELGAGQTYRVDVGIELGSILKDDLGIAHLNPERPCNGVTASEPGFRECPYWMFRVIDEKQVGMGFGGTDVGLNANASADSSRNVTFVMDPQDFFVYVGYSQGDMDSIKLSIEPSGAEERDPLLQNDNGIGFSQHGYIPFSPRTTYGIESEIDRLGMNFQGHLVIDKADIPLGGFVKLDGSFVFKLPVDELTGEAQFDNHWQGAGNGDLKLSLPLYKFVSWGMHLGEATAGATVTSEQQYLYVSGDINKDFPWAPQGLPMSLDYRNNYQAAAILVNDVDPDTAVPFLNLTDSFVQIEGEFLMDFSLGNAGSEFGREMRSSGFFRADFDNGIEFWGEVGTGAAATMIHPLIQADAGARAYLKFNPSNLDETELEITGSFEVGGDTFEQQAILRVTPDEGYLGFPLSFDPALVLQAYNDIQDATRDAEAEVNKLTVEIDRQRAIVQAERDKAQADVNAAQQDVDAAQAKVNLINAQIAKHYSNISYYKGRISSWYRWYKKQPWYKRASAWATYTAKKAYYNGLIAAQYTAIGAEKVALAAATAALDVARTVLAGYKAVLVVTPIDLDPRVAPLVAARDVALAALNGLQEAMPEIPEIPGTIEATAGFRIDNAGLTPESRALYCDGGTCIEIKGGSYDRKAGRACITLPTADNRRVCTAIPAEPV